MKTQNVSKTVTNATKKARAKKQSVAIKLQRQLKQAHEKEIKGLNALVNYSTGKGKFAQFTEGKKATDFTVISLSLMLTLSLSFTYAINASVAFLPNDTRTKQEGRNEENYLFNLPREVSYQQNW